MSGRYRVTLVHGTRLLGNLAPAATWVEDSSALCRTLRSELGEEAKIECFRWSGRNDHEGRAKAASALAGDISTRLDADPDAVHAIIAHSHGGNIALTAAADPRIANRIGKVVCMSTPFFLPSERDVIGTLLSIVRGYLWFFGVTTPLCVLVSVMWPLSRFNWLGISDHWIAWVTGAAFAVAGALVLGRAQKRLAEWIARLQEQKIAEIEAPKPGATPVLCIWAKGDEVVSLFRWLDRLAGFTLVLLRPWSIAVVIVLTAVLWLAPATNNAIYKMQAFGEVFFKVMIVTFLPFALLSDYIAKFTNGDVLIALPLTILLMAAMLIMFFSIASIFVALPFHWALKALPFGMKDWRFLDTFFLRIAPGPTPQDRAGVVAEPMRLSGRLRHSAVYKSEEAAKKIAAFIRA